jgi:cytochrome c-type biogenesis protein CcmF
VALAALLTVLALMWRGPWLAPFGIAIGVWVMVGSLAELAFRVKAGTASVNESLRRLVNLPRSAFGTTAAHFGIGMLVVGIVATTAYQSEQVLVMRPGEKTEIGGYTLHFKGAAPRSGPNYLETAGIIEVTRGGSVVTVLNPSKRLFSVPRQVTTEAGIHVSWRGDLYTVLGEEQTGGAFTVRLYFNPLVRFIWLGAVVMFIGGALSLSDRRLRIGVPQVARRRMRVQPAE